MKIAMKKITVYLSIAVLLVAAQPAYGQSACEGGGMKMQKEGGGGKFHAILEEMDLKPEQREQLWEQRAENREKMKEVNAALREERRSLRKELQKSDSSEQLIQNIVSKMKELEGERIDRRVDNFLKMKEILTPEQFQKMCQMKKQAKHRKRGRHGKGSRGGMKEE